MKKEKNKKKNLGEALSFHNKKELLSFMQAVISLDFMHETEIMMIKKDIARIDLSTMTGIYRRRLSRLFRADSIISIKEMAKIGHALKVRIHISFSKPLEEDDSGKA